MFKVGDWVYRNQFGLKEDRPLFQVTFDHISELMLKNCELWQPKPGEYCWMMSNKCEWPKLVKFTHMKNGHYCSGFAAFEKCEPFIGTLPSFLQD